MPSWAGTRSKSTQLATAAQRAFTFTSPAAEQKITIGGVEYELKAGETSKELAAAINSDSSSTVYASAQEDGTIVLSTRTTGNTGAEFVNVSAAGVLAEVAGSAREGRNAEFTVDGVAGTSASNTVTNAIAGVTLTLTGLTSGDPVTIDVQPPGASTSAIESQVQSFVKLYNTTIASIQKQLTTKPPAKPSTAAEYGTGTLFGDLELGSLLGAMRETMYEPITGMAAEMSSLDSIGVSTGAAGGAGGTSSATLEGQLTVNTAKLAEAVRGEPNRRRADARAVVKEPPGRPQRSRRTRRVARSEDQRRQHADHQLRDPDQQHERNSRRQGKSAHTDICDA